MTLNGTHQLRVYADYVNISGRHIHTIKKNTEALAVASTDSLEVNADKTKYIVMSRDQDARRSHSINMDNSYFERVEEFNYFGTT